MSSAAAAGGRPSLRAVEPYVERVYGYALRRTPDRHAAQDLAQEILLQVCRSVARGNEVRDMDAWVWRIARNTSARWFHARRALQECSLDEVQERGSYHVGGWLPSDLMEDDVIERLARREAVRGLLAALARTSAEYRRIVVMHHLQGRSVSEIAHATGLAEGTVKRRLHTARNRLRERMTQLASIRQAEPPQLTVYTNGRGAPDRYFRRRIAQSIAMAAFETPRTIEDLADDLGVAAAFIEDEVRHLVDREVMAAVGANRYQTDFAIATIAAQREIYRDVERLVARDGASVRDALRRLEPDVRAVGFHGAGRPWGEILWTLVPMTFYTAHERHCERERIGSYAQAPDRRDGGRWYAVGYETGGGSEPAFPWRGGNNFEHARWDGASAVFHNAWLEGLGLRAGMLVPEDIRLLVALVAPGGTGGVRAPADADGPGAGRLADLIARGFVERLEEPDRGVVLRPTLPVFTREQQRRLLEVLGPVLDIDGRLVREAYAFCHAAMEGRVPRRLHDQLWPFLGCFVDDVKGYLLRFLVEEGTVTVPRDPSTSTCGMYIVYGPRG